MRKQGGPAIVGMLSVMLAMVASATPAAARPVPRGALPPPGPPLVRSALAWGSNHLGQVGDGSTAERQALPVQPYGLGSGVSQVAAGLNFTLAVRNGTVLAWGDNHAGQLGDGTVDRHLIPTAIPSLANITKVSAGMAHSLALRSDGTVWAWGANYYGQLGNGTREGRRLPVRVSNLTGVTDIAAGGWFSLALRSDGTVWAWGYNADGQLGDGTLVHRLRPVKVPGLANVVQVAAGGFHSMTVRSDGVAFGWGSNREGQLGDGTRNDRAAPGRVTVVTGVTQIAAGWVNTLALSDGRPHWWGQSTQDCDGNQPDGAATRPLSEHVLPGLTDVVRIAAGYWHGLAVRSDGTLWSWGINSEGQLGDGTTTIGCDPVPVLAASGSIQIAGGAAHTIVVVERPVVIGP
jgi:alpha-tubulin suppressor-like RCC1 family protein